MELIEIARFVLSSISTVLILIAAVAAPQLRTTTQGNVIHSLLLFFALVVFTSSDFLRHGLDYPLVSIVNSLFTLTLVGGITYWVGSRDWVRKILLGQ